MSKQSKQEILRERISAYLALRGLDIHAFTPQIRDFFADGIEHYDRLAYRDALAECLNLDMGREKDRDQLWKNVAESLGISRKVRGQWVTGEIDPPPEALRLCLLQLAAPRIRPKLDTFLDLTSPVRLGISRTIIYINIFPPHGFRDERFIAGQPRDLLSCWDQLKRHVHFRNPMLKPRKDLNQHALDFVREKFGERFWLAPGDIGKVMREVERDQTGGHPWFWPFLTFKYATFLDISSTNHRKANPHRWIWDDTRIDRFTEIWGE